MTILAFSGSLKKASFNSSIINEIKKHENENLKIKVYTGLGDLPYFNPDLDIHTLETDDSPLVVQEFREMIFKADALIISTPEYAFEIPGVLKNALDWLVSSNVIIHKPVAIISASTSGTGGEKAHKVLTDLLNLVSGNVVENSKLIVSRVNKKFDEAGNIIDKDLVKDLKDSVNELVLHIKGQRT